MFRHLTYFLAAVVLISLTIVLQSLFSEGLEKYGKKKKEMENGGVKKKEMTYQSREKKAAKKVEMSATMTEESDIATDSMPSVTTEDNQGATFDGEKPLLGKVDDRPFFLELIEGYLQPILTGLAEGRAREDVTIRYYRHEKDGDHVYALQELGYYLHKKEARETKGLESNVLIYGSDVDIRDIQIVAYTLLENEVPLKAIQKSKYTWKYHALEVGTNPDLHNLPIMTLADIRSFELAE